MTKLTVSRPRTARRWLRLSVRGLILIVLFIGGGLGWFEHRARVQRDAVAVLESVNAQIDYDLDTYQEGVPINRCVKWLVEVFGIDRVATVDEVYGGPKFNDTAMAAVSRLVSLRKLSIVDCPVTDAGVAAGLGELRRLESLELYGDEGGPKLTRAIIPAMANLGRLEELVLSNTTMKLDDSDLERISRLGRLRHVTLGGAGITDRGMAGLARLTSLEELHIVDTAVTEVGLAQLARCKKLTRLDLEGSKATTLEPLRDLPNLKILLVSNGPLTTLWTTPVTGLGRLETLHVVRTSLADAGLAHLDGLPGLKSLALDEATFTDAGMAHVGRCVALLKLTVSSVKITTLRPLRNLHRLEGLYLANTEITTLEPVRDMPRLEELKAPYCPITVAWKTPPTGLNALWLLDLSGAPIGGEGLARLDELPSVTYLYLSEAGVDDAGLTYVGAMKSLSYLDLESTPITDASLAGLSTLTKLSDLDLSHTAIGDAAVPHLLAISGSPEITMMRTRLTDAGLLRLTAPGGFRGSLHLGGPSLTKEGVQAAQAANPGLKITVQGGDEPPSAAGGDQ